MNDSTTPANNSNTSPTKWNSAWDSATGAHKHGFPLPQTYLGMLGATRGSNGGIMLPPWTVHLPLTCTERMVHAVVLKRSGKYGVCWESDANIAASLSLSDRAVRDALNRLGQDGFTRRGNKVPGLGLILRHDGSRGRRGFWPLMHPLNEVSFRFLPVAEWRGAELAQYNSRHELVASGDDRNHPAIHPELTRPDAAKHYAGFWEEYADHVRYFANLLADKRRTAETIKADLDTGPSTALAS